MAFRSSYCTSVLLFVIGSVAAAQPQAPPPANAAPAPQPLPRATFIADMDREFRAVDGNGDATITTAELVSAQERTALAVAQRQAQMLFRQLDADNNGQLSAAEFSKLATRTATPNPASSPLMRFDANKDGRVTLVEYRIGTQANFDRLDTDKDGIVSPAEMKAGGIK